MIWGLGKKRAKQRAKDEAGEAPPEAPIVEGLALYQFDACPYCRRVRSAIERLGLEVEIRDTLMEPDHAAALIEATGSRTVPVLRIEEPGGEVRWMAESADIIGYLHDRFD